MSKFCTKCGKELNEIGLTEREANEFIMYWLPKMEENGNNLVHFDRIGFSVVEWGGTIIN